MSEVFLFLFFFQDFHSIEQTIDLIKIIITIRAFFNKLDS